ncbi:YdcF family protein [Arthrobacter sulfonylureivorans]|uniref:YdcF family protein n=1 Tax=Arthrobacter sulfonylureivorans TaxID=2486855 RepID=A0ABY3WD70_9MICC|nr:YdcF family protein [Arthrobacter sulfonylureivorans]UNK47362.1 YdcF family protein [Arthrobacter sulfonylureivorans]
MPSSRIAFIPRRALMAMITVISALTAILMIWLAACYALFYNPSTEPVRSADAVVVLAGASSERLPVGLALMDQGIAPVLVLSSTGNPGNVHADRICDQPSLVPYDLICFTPDVDTTRGEARSIARLAEDNGWDSVTVVTSRYHVTRASAYIGQCSDEDINLVASKPNAGAIESLRRFVEESVALASAWIRPVCASRI